MTKILRALLYGFWTCAAPFGLIYLYREFSLVYRSLMGCKVEDVYLGCADSMFGMFLCIGLFAWGFYFISELPIKQDEKPERFGR